MIEFEIPEPVRGVPVAIRLQGYRGKAGGEDAGFKLNVLGGPADTWDNDLLDPLLIDLMVPVGTPPLGAGWDTYPGLAEPYLPGAGTGFDVTTPAFSVDPSHESVYVYNGTASGVYSWAILRRMDWVLGGVVVAPFDNLVAGKRGQRAHFSG